MLKESDFEEYREVNVQEILELLKVEYQMLISWGARSFKNVYNKGLLFQVNGFKHKGKVLILLNGSDYYEVKILNHRDRVLDTLKDIGFEELSKRIDERIELTETYKEDVNQFMKETLIG